LKEEGTILDTLLVLYIVRAVVKWFTTKSTPVMQHELWYFVLCPHHYKCFAPVEKK